MIEYIFQIPEIGDLNFQIDLRRKYTQAIDQQDHPFWTRLDYKQCQNCPLPPGSYQHCPTAVDLEDIVSKFSPLPSFDVVEVAVKTPHREYRKHCDIQTGLQALLGLVMATSACPILSRLRSLANFHLPFATTEDTLFRTVGAYLLQQYFIYADGGIPDFELRELEALYNSLGQLNFSFTQRIQAASDRDANLNAIVQLGALSFMVQLSLEEQLKEFRAGFQGEEPFEPDEGALE